MLFISFLFGVDTILALIIHFSDTSKEMPTAALTNHNNDFNVEDGEKC